jgi:hypothetical protein
MGAKIIRCRHCRHRFYAIEDRCPECHRRSPQGRLKVLAWCLIVTLGIAVALLVLKTCIKDVSTPEKLPSADSL